MPFESCEEFIVVRNHEDQYSIWPAELALPAGWSEERMRGPRAGCLEYIERVWTDMRPRGLRQSTDRAAG